MAAASGGGGPCAGGGATQVLARIDSLATSQQRVEETLAEIRQDLANLAAFLQTPVAGTLRQSPAPQQKQQEQQLLQPPQLAGPGPDAGPWAKEAALPAQALAGGGGGAAASWWAKEGLLNGCEDAPAPCQDSCAASEGLPPLPPSLPAAWPASVRVRRGWGDVQESPRHNHRDSRPETPQVFHLDRVDMKQSGTGQLTSQESLGGRSRLSWLMVHPHSNFAVVYSLCMVLVLFHDLTVIPFMLAWDYEFTGGMQVSAWSSTLFWTFDITMSFRTGFHKGDTVEMRPGAVARKFARTWLLPDLTMSVCDWLGMALLANSGSQRSNSQGLLKILRVSRLGKCFRIFAFLRMTKITGFIEDFVEANFSSMACVVLRCLLLCLGALWLNHLICCSWFAVGRLAPADTRMRWVDTTRELDGVVEHFLETPPMYQYITALHWSMAQFTLGAIEIPCYNTFERLFNIVCLMMGMIFGSTLVSLLSASMVDYQMVKKEQTQKLRRLRRFLRENSVSQGTALLVQQQAAERLNIREKLREQDVPALQAISASLRRDLRFELAQPYLCSHPLLNLWYLVEPHTVKRLCADTSEAVDFAFLRPQDDLFTAGSLADKAFYLVEGHLNYTQEPDTSPQGELQVATVGPGTWLCEAALWTEWTHVGTAKANVACRVLVLPAAGVLAALERSHSDFRGIMLEYCECFHRSLTAARPPAAKWPDDLQVPFTDYGDIVMAMDRSYREAVGLMAIDYISTRNWQLGSLSSSLGKLREEVVSGKSCVTLGAEAQLERLCAVDVLRLEAAGSGRLLVELGRAEEDGGGMEACCQLPGGKRQHGEKASDSVARLLSRLGLPENLAEPQCTERQVQWKQSKEFGVHTKYLRTVHVMKLPREEDIELPVVDVPNEFATTTIRQRSLSAAFHTFRIGRTGSGSLDVPSLRGSEHEEATVYSLRHGSRRQLLAWLMPGRFEHLASASGERELAAWVAALAASSVQEAEATEAETFHL